MCGRITAMRWCCQILKKPSVQVSKFFSVQPSSEDVRDRIFRRQASLGWIGSHRHLPSRSLLSAMIFTFVQITFAVAGTFNSIFAEYHRSRQTTANWTKRRLLLL
ncbi:hypothetical protein TNCV_2243431 [Trichonephila clavipes]|nr:hypothetical protein TNCV_2243431 [Trichonephila clavipes]